MATKQRAEPTRRPLPTKAPPGTKAKLDILIARHAAGELLWHPDDEASMATDHGAWEFLIPETGHAPTNYETPVYYDQFRMTADDYEH